MRQTAHVRRALAASLVPVLLVLTGCSGGDDRSSAEPSADTESGSTSGEPVEPNAAPGDEIDPAQFLDRLQAGFDATTTARMQMESTGDLEVSAEGDVDYSSKPPDMALTLTIPSSGQSAEVILTGGSIYANLPGLTQGKYVAYELDAPDSPLPEEMRRLFDPSAMVGMLGDGLETVTYVGEEDLDGTGTAHYLLAIDTTGMTSAEGERIPRELEYDIWLDEQDRTRQLVMTLEGTELTTTLSDHGEPVTIEAPPANQIMEPPRPQ